MANKKQKGATKTALPAREVDVQFERLNKDFQHPLNRMIQRFAIPIFSFSLLGLIWIIPFPKIEFLEKYGYDIFLNWGSFFIAAVIYAYLRLAPTLSYGMLFVIGVFSFLIVQLEYVERDGGPAVWMVCGILLLCSFFALYMGKTMERKPVSARSFCRLLTLGPIWLLHSIFRKLKIPY